MAITLVIGPLYHKTAEGYNFSSLPFQQQVPEFSAPTSSVTEEC